MIHIITVHWRDDRWVDIQLEYLRRHICEPFRVYAFLNSLPADHRSKYYYSSTEEIKSHAIKLNLLADMVALQTTERSDWLLFLDGDAFPIGDVVPYAQGILKNCPLLAIQRRENGGDIQPHPSFCLTTVGFWKEIAGDWNEGFTWHDQAGQQVTDVGGNLLRILNNNGIPWHPMLRTNRVDLHPVWFGIYDNVIYHHGAGFRRPLARIDVLHGKNEIAALPLRHRLYRRLYSALPQRLVWCLKKPYNPFLWRAEQNTELSKQVFQFIASDAHFYRSFQGSIPFPAIIESTVLAGVPLTRAHARSAGAASANMQGKTELRLSSELGVTQFCRVAHSVLPPAATVAIVSKGDDRLLNLQGRRAWHFPQSDDGKYLGYHPADSSEAITNLNRLRARGAEYLAFPDPSRWWLDHYLEFRQYLDAEHSVLWRDETCTIYELKPPAELLP